MPPKSSPRKIPYAYLFACTITGIAILLTAYNGSLSWLLLCGFAVVVFPQWRGKLYRLAEKYLTKRGRHDCDDH